MYLAIRDRLMRWMAVSAELPRAPLGNPASVSIRRASTRFLLYRLTVHGLVLAFIGALLGAGFLAASVAGDGRAAGLLLFACLPLALVAFFVYLLVRLEYDLRTYVITDRAIRVRSGAWTVCERTISYANVQNLAVVQGPLQRFFNIWTLRVETAGGGASGGEQSSAKTHGVELAGLEDAYDLRDSILSYMRREARRAGLGDLDDGTGRAAAAVRVELEALARAARELHQASRRVP